MYGRRETWQTYECVVPRSRQQGAVQGQEGRQQRSRTHQHLEEDDEELVAGHEVAVQNPQVEPAAEAAEHLDQHLLIVARLLHTRRLGE